MAKAANTAVATLTSVKIAIRMATGQTNPEASLSRLSVRLGGAGRRTGRGCNTGPETTPGCGTSVKLGCSQRHSSAESVGRALLLTLSG